MYYLFSDLEGTLTVDKKITDAALSVLKKFIQNNKLCILSTAFFNELKSFFDKLGVICNMYSASSNVLYLEDKVITNHIDKSICLNILNKLPNLYTAYCTCEDRSYVVNYIEKYEPIYPVNRVEKLDFNPTAITLIIYNEDKDFVYSLAKEYNLNIVNPLSDSKKSLVRLAVNKPTKEYVCSYILNSLDNNYTTIGASDNEGDHSFVSLCDIKLMASDFEGEFDNIDQFFDKKNGVIELLQDICKL